MAPGMPNEMTPYRAETSGLFGIASFLRRLTQQHPGITGKITIACDCKGALDRAFQEQPPNPRQPDFDLFAEIYRLRRLMNIKWTKRWVQGHQDRTNIPVQNLDHWAQINIAMDALAKQHWSRLNTRRPPPFSLPSSENTWSLWQSGIRITRWDSPSANQRYFNASALAYWSQKYASFPALDFDAIRLAYKSTSLFYQATKGSEMDRPSSPSRDTHCPMVSHQYLTMSPMRNTQ